jgi:nitrogen fixation/metabolism regulation signal transduction histidine kinase
MPTISPKIRKWLSISSMLGLFGSLLLSLLLTSDALQNAARFEQLYSLLLAVNIIALITLFGLIALNLRRLWRQVRRGLAGARLMVRLVTLIVILAVVPVSVVYYFSLEFLHQRLGSWLDVNVDQALNNALELSRVAMDARMREALKNTETIAQELSNVDPVRYVSLLNEAHNRTNVEELTLLGQNGQILAFNGGDEMGGLLPSHPYESLLLQLKRTNTYVSVVPIKDGSLHIRVVLRFVHRNNNFLFLHALYPTPERVSNLAAEINNAYEIYKERFYLRESLKLSFTLLLSLILLLSIFSAVWAAFFVARRFVAPLSNLAEGTRAVASGNYDKQFPVSQLDELGFLVQSFNDMTRNIAQARDEAKHSQQFADRQRTYLEAVLSRLSSGVISLDHAQCLRTANPAASQILGLPLHESVGINLTQLQDEHAALQPLYLAIHNHWLTGSQDWRAEVVLFVAGGRKVLMCRGTQLTLDDDIESGQVIVFDDVTALIQAQRDAAWSEVARRLAHEIKNPLTPIQLSAERLRQKYLQKMPEKDAEILDRLTHTIIQQVDAMKEMLNAFSDYARTPQMRWQRIQLNDLIKEVLDLYLNEQAFITTKFDENLPPVEVDRGRLRQVLHNLVKNALEANPQDTSIAVTTRYLAESNFECVELRMQDQGEGIPEHLLDQIFEPYVTTKTKGTGLGLAIVKKIVEEHGGMVWIENNPGACVVIRLPVAPQVAPHLLPSPAPALTS